MKTIHHKTIRQITVACFALLALGLPNLARAQFTGDFQTNVIDGTAVDWPGYYYVGSSYVSDALFIANGGFLSSQGAFIGSESGGDSNLATVSTSGSRWTNWGHFYVGYNGSYNRLIISDGGKVQTSGGSAVVGSQSSSIYNSVLLKDSGSAWNCGGSLFIGDGGSYCSMVISNGGGVSSYQGFVGGNFGGNSNVALVTGSGSVWRTACITSTEVLPRNGTRPVTIW